MIEKKDQEIKLEQETVQNEVRFYVLLFRNYSSPPWLYEQYMQQITKSNVIFHRMQEEEG